MGGIQSLQDKPNNRAGNLTQDFAKVRWWGLAVATHKISEQTRGLAVDINSVFSNHEMLGSIISKIENMTCFY